MFAYLHRLLDSTDRTADCLAVGILLGFFGFNFMFGAVTLVFVAHAFHKAEFDPGATAAMMTSMGATYAAVLGATTGAYRWRQPDAQNSITGPKSESKSG